MAGDLREKPAVSEKVWTVVSVVKKGCAAPVEQVIVDEVRGGLDVPEEDTQRRAMRSAWSGRAERCGTL